MKKTYSPILIRLAAAAAALCATSALYLVARANPDWVSGPYMVWSRGAIHILALITGWFPFSLAEFLIYGGIVALTVCTVLTLVRVLTHRRQARSLLRLLATVLLIASCALLFYEGVWALGYHSRPLADSLGYSTAGGYTRDQLASAAKWMLDAVNSEAGLVERDENGVCAGVPFDELSDMACESWNTLASENEYFADFHPVAVKPVLASELMSYANITGIFIAFTGEANLNISAPASSLPFTAAHELAHASMVCPENEANFAAWLACRASSYHIFRYSGALAGFIYLYNSLYREDAEAAFDLYRQLDPLVQADMEYRSEYWASYEGPIEKVSTAVNNAYLQVMAQPDGVKSYGMVSDLLIAAYLSDPLSAY